MRTIDGESIKVHYEARVVGKSMLFYNVRQILADHQVVSDLDWWSQIQQSVEEESYVLRNIIEAVAQECIDQRRENPDGIVEGRDTPQSICVRIEKKR